MNIKIFYSWQSDIDRKFNRNFIKDCLERTIKKLNKSLTVEEAIRLDHDTKDVTGSPDIANTILQKIDECDVFIGDITFVSKSEKGRCFSNPNVLIELGYALKSLSDGRLLNVMNTAFGEPEENLPFDLAHKRWPLQYALSTENYSDKPQIRDKFVTDLYNALVPFTKNKNIKGPIFSSNVEIIRHREKLRKEFDKELLEIKQKKLRSDIIIRDVDRFDGYLHSNEEEKGISSWFRIGLLETYTKGIKVGLRIGTLATIEDGYRYTKMDEQGDITVLLVGEIPYDSIVEVNWEGDEYYSFPHIYCHFNHNDEPYERLFYCEKIDMGHGHTYYKEVAIYNDVKENSKGSGTEYFS